MCIGLADILSTSVNAEASFMSVETNLLIPDGTMFCILKLGITGSDATVLTTICVGLDERVDISCSDETSCWAILVISSVDLSPDIISSFEILFNPSLPSTSDLISGLLFFDSLILNRTKSGKSCKLVFSGMDNPKSNFDRGSTLVSISTVRVTPTIFKPIS